MHYPNVQSFYDVCNQSWQYQARCDCGWRGVRWPEQEQASQDVDAHCEPMRLPELCSTCNRPFWKSGDNWYRAKRMHDDRIGRGELSFCSRWCLRAWIESEEEIGSPAPYVRLPQAPCHKSADLS